MKFLNAIVGYLANKLTLGTGLSGTSYDGSSAVTASINYEATATNIKMNGTQAVGALNTTPRGDHVHPVDTSRAALSHVHGNITNAGAIGTTTDLIVKTTASGVLTTLAAGTTAQYLRGDGSWQSVSGAQLLGSAAVKGIAYNAQTIAENVAIPTVTNAYSAGPITISDGYTVTIADGSVWTIF